ncbi:hypothetical protein SAMN05880593_11553 [Rhizobium sp. RU36D]|nr:hypothetical protein SAMN05880593_11553 [Rhizobium sp. RU36D]
MTAMGGVLPTPAAIKRSIVGYFVIGLLLLTAYVALVVGLCLYVAREEGPITAAFLVAALAVASALIALAIMGYLDRRARMQALILRQQALSMQGAMAPFQGQLMGALHPLLPVMIRQSPIASTVVVACLAYALAKSKGVGRSSK